MSRAAIAAAWGIGLAAIAGAVVFGVVAVATAIGGEYVIARWAPFTALAVACASVGLQVGAARRAGVTERYLDDTGPGGRWFSLIAVSVGVYAGVSMIGGYEPINGAVVMNGLATAMCVRSANLAALSIRRGHTGEPGGGGSCKTP